MIGKPASRAEIGHARRARTRARLVGAATQVFARLGPDAPALEDVASAAGVARGTIYNHFETREALLTAVAIEAAEVIGLEILPLRALPDPAHRLGASLRCYIRRAAAEPEWGWAVVRIAFVAAPLGTRMTRDLGQDLREGLEGGRFHAASMQAAADVVLGAGILGMRAVLRGEAPEGHAEGVALAVLRALGVADAEAVARLPLALPGLDWAL